MINVEQRFKDDVVELKLIKQIKHHSPDISGEMEDGAVEENYRMYKSALRQAQVNADRNIKPADEEL